MRGRVRAAALALLVAGGAGRAGAVAYSFHGVADSAGPYTNFAGAPVINEDGDVAFAASLDDGTQGIFSGPDPGTDTIADDQGPYGAPLDHPSINREGTVAFRAFLDPSAERPFGGRGIFTGPDPAVDTVVDDNGDFFGDFGGPSIADDGTVAFDAITNLLNGFGVWTGDDPEADLVADSTGPCFAFAFAAINDVGTVAFEASLDAGGLGIFTGDDPLNDTVADTDGPYLDFGPDYGPALNDADTVLFFARLDAGGAGLFTGPDPAADTVVDTSGPYAAFDAFSINDAGTVLFSAVLDAGPIGLFTGPDPVADRVLVEGDPLFGSTVAFVSLATENLNDNGELAFSSVPADRLRGVAVASPAALERPVAAGAGYAGVRLVSAAGRDTVARLRGGAAGADRVAALSATPGGGQAVGDVVRIEGTGSDLVIVELTYSDDDLAAAGGPDEAALRLYERVASGVWRNAVLGNAPPGGSALPGVSFDAYRSGLGGPPALGAHGNDPDGNTVWAVVDHGGAFAVPEPPASATGLAALAALVARPRARRAGRLSSARCADRWATSST